MDVGLIIVLVLILVIIGVLYSVYINITKKVKRFSRDVFGTEDIVKGLKDVEDERRNKPLSISGGNSIYLPRIKTDFPDYHQTTMEEKVKHFILVYLKALESKSVSHLEESEITNTVKESITSKVTDLIDNDEKQRYDNIRFHGISIIGYTKTKELATVKYQIAFEYLGSIRKCQAKYEVDVTYLFEDLSSDSFSLRCNHCGGSLKETSTICEYCGTLIVRNITKVWVISNFKLLQKIV